MGKVGHGFKTRHRPKGCPRIRSTNHSKHPENRKARGRQQARYRLQTDIEAQICAEQKHRKAIECHRKETPQRALSQQRCKSLGAKTGNRQSPTTAMPQQQCRNKNRSPRHPTKWKPQPPQRAENRIPPSRHKAAPATYPRHRIFKSIIVHNKSLIKGHF